MGLARMLGCPSTVNQDGASLYMGLQPNKCITGFEDLSNFFETFLLFPFPTRRRVVTIEETAAGKKVG